MIFEVAPEIKSIFQGKPAFEAALDLQGEVFRELEQRRTLEFQHQGKSYFIKMHYGISWKELIKNFTQLKKPVLGAANEWFALNHLSAAGVHTAEPIAYFDDQAFATKRKSFVVMSSVQNFIDLGNLAKMREWTEMQADKRKQLVKAVAEMARKIHKAGIHHRDFYLCHILLDKHWLEGNEAEPKLTIIDLHRSTFEKALSESQIIKDIGALYYSVLIEAGLTNKEALLFVKHYAQVDSAAAEIRNNKKRWDAIVKKAESIFLRDYARLPKVNFTND